MGALVCFDVDGCLIDSDVPMVSALNRALSGFGLPTVDLERIRPHLGPPLVDTLRGLLADLGSPTGDAPALAVAYRQAYAETSVDNVSVYAGVPGLLERLTAAGHELRIVSSKPPRYSEPLLQAADLRPFFDGVFGPLGEETEPKRLTLARALQAPTSATRTFMVGDTEADVVAARANDVVSVAVTWGYATTDTLRAARPDHLAMTPADVEHAIARALR